MNWLDLVLLLTLASSLIGGLQSGFARVGISLASTILAFLCGSWFYRMAAVYVQPYVSSVGAAQLIGFLLIFLSIILLGALVSRVVTMVFRIIGLSWLDRLAGGAFGLLRGVFMSSVLIMILLAFSRNGASPAVVHSRFAPYIVDAANVLAAATPRELKDGYRRSYEMVKSLWSTTVNRGLRTIPKEMY